MNKKKHILITIIITVFSLVICPLIYNQPFVEYNLYTGKNQVKYDDRIKKDNLILNKKENEVRIMTLNLLAHYKSWGGKPVEERSDIFFSIRDGYLPDVLGLQEMCFDWYNEINKNKSEYKFVAPLKTAFPQKMTAILYNSDTVELIDSGSITFSDCWNFKSRRAVWGVFRHIRTDKIFTVVNTHLSFIEESEEAQNFFTQTCQVNELYNVTQTLESQYPYPIFIIGDFNTKRRVSYQKSVINSGSYGILNSLYTDSEDIAKNKYYGENFNFNNTLNDHIFIKGEVTVKNLSLLSQDCFCTLSDHYPLFADIKL
ncbi:MAG: hypothetical protein IKK46_08475 [Clostridia bacterium]|nr:hypothetical protein [Clostridia bacterium]